MEKTLSLSNAYSKEAEEQLIGHICQHYIETWDEISPLPADSFYNDKHRAIYQAVHQLSEQGEIPDILTIMDTLETNGNTTQVSFDELARIIGNVSPNMATVSHWIEKVKTLHVQRSLIKYQLLVAGINLDNPDEALRKIETSLDIVRSTNEATREKQAQKNIRPLPSASKLLHLPQTTWIVDRLIPDNANTFLVAPPNVAKTFVALGIALSHATGMNRWLNMDMKETRGGVYYLFGEGVSSIPQRVQAWLRHTEHTWDDLEGWFHPEVENKWGETGTQFDILNEQHVTELISMILSAANKIDMIFFDTLACINGSGEENSNTDMARLARNIERIRKETDTAVIVLHHTGKDGQFRGASALNAAIDATIQIEGQPNDENFTIKNAKQRGGPIHIPIVAMKLPIILGIDEKGKELSSCVIVESNVLFEDLKEKQPTGDLLKMLVYLVESTPNVTYTKWLNGSEVTKDNFNKLLRTHQDKGYWLKSEQDKTYTATNKTVDLVQKVGVLGGKYTKNTPSTPSENGGEVGVLGVLPPLGSTPSTPTLPITEIEENIQKGREDNKSYEVKEYGHYTIEDFFPFIEETTTDIQKVGVLSGNTPTSTPTYGYEPDTLFNFEEEMSINSLYYEDYAVIPIEIDTTPAMCADSAPQQKTARAHYSPVPSCLNPTCKTPASQFVYKYNSGYRAEVAYCPNCQVPVKDLHGNVVTATMFDVQVRN
jgi:hypothetical protein